jgi:hypothetical protein
MSKLFKETMQTIEIRLTSGTKIRLVPSIGQRDDMVFSYTSEDIDVAFHLPATAANYYVLSNHISLGRYSQALSEAAYRDAVSGYKRSHCCIDTLELTA